MLKNRSWGPQHTCVNGQVIQTESAVKEMDLASVECCPSCTYIPASSLHPTLGQHQTRTNRFLKTKITEPHAHARLVDPLSTVTESATQSNAVRNKGIQFGKEEAKLSLFVVNMILHIRKLKPPPKKLQNYKTKTLSTDMISVKMPDTRSACKN